MRKIIAILAMFILLSVLVASVTIVWEGMDDTGGEDDEEEEAIESNVHIMIRQNGENLTKEFVKNGETIEISADSFEILVDKVEEEMAVYFNAEKKLAESEYFSAGGQTSEADYLSGKIRVVEGQHTSNQKNLLGTVRSGATAGDITNIYAETIAATKSIGLNEGEDIEVLGKKVAMYFKASSNCGGVMPYKDGSSRCTFNVSQFNEKAMKDYVKEDTTINVIAILDQSGDGEYDLEPEDILRFKLHIKAEEALELPCYNPLQCLAKIDMKLVDALK